tara:strand:+ start:3981 stop:4523 length:543 start_codon:yes stop_codon:yes gene_type:complete
MSHSTPGEEGIEEDHNGQIDLRTEGTSPGPSINLVSLIWIVCVFIGGAMLPIQAGLINQVSSVLGSRNYGLSISYLGGALGIVLFSFVSHTPAVPAVAAMEVPVLCWFAGIFGLFYLGILTTAIPVIGAALSFSLVVAGQLFASTFFEQLGWLGNDQNSISLQKVLGLVFVITGVILIRI